MILVYGFVFIYLIVDFFKILIDFYGKCRLFGYGIGIHLLQAPEPEKLPKKTEINPKDNHISFQVNIFPI